MIRFSTVSAPAAALLLLFALPATASPDDVLDRDLQTLMRWFPGVYDNQEQVYFEQELEVPEDERHERIHHTFAHVELPAFGDNVLYVQQYINDDPEQIYRQRIYVFTADYEEGAVRLTIHTPNDVAALVDAHLEPAKLDSLTPDDTRVIPGCEVFWKRQASQFIGYMKPGACSFESRQSGKRIVIDDDLVLSDDAIWISDRAEDEDGNYVFGNRAGIPHKNLKARRFECWIAAQERDGENWTFRQGLEVFDQGGRIWIDTEEEEPQRVGIKLRNVRWPSGRNRDSFVLYTYRDDGDHPEDRDRAIAYAWGEPTATRLAVNLRWIQASCTHAPR